MSRSGLPCVRLVQALSIAGAAAATISQGVAALASMYGTAATVGSPKPTIHVLAMAGYATAVAKAASGIGRLWDGKGSQRSDDDTVSNTLQANHRVDTSLSFRFEAPPSNLKGEIRLQAHLSTRGVVARKKTN